MTKNYVLKMADTDGWTSYYAVEESWVNWSHSPAGTPIPLDLIEAWQEDDLESFMDNEPLTNQDFKYHYLAIAVDKTYLGDSIKDVMKKFPDGDFEEIEGIWY